MNGAKNEAPMLSPLGGNKNVTPKRDMKITGKKKEGQVWQLSGAALD